MKIPFPKYDEQLVLAIEKYLNQDGMTELVGENHNCAERDGVIYTRHVGAAQSTCVSKIRCYSRPIFQLIHIDSSSTVGARSRGCPDCDNWAYTWDCEQHTERTWDSDKRKWSGTPDPLPVEGTAFADIISGMQVRPSLRVDHGRWTVSTRPPLIIHAETTQASPSIFTIQVEQDPSWPT